MLKKNIIEFHTFPINDHLLNELDERLVDRMKWFAQGFYTITEKDGKIMVYNMQCDMQGVREFEDIHNFNALIIIKLLQFTVELLRQ